MGRWEEYNSEITREVPKNLRVTWSERWSNRVLDFDLRLTM